MLSLKITTIFFPTAPLMGNVDFCEVKSNDEENSDVHCKPTSSYNKVIKVQARLKWASIVQQPVIIQKSIIFDEITFFSNDIEKQHFGKVEILSI